MFYRIRNHIFNLDRVIDIHIKGEFLIVDMDKSANVNISIKDIDSSKLMDKIQSDLHTLYGGNYADS